MPRQPKNWKHRGVSKKLKQLAFDLQKPTLPLATLDQVNADPVKPKRKPRK